MWNETALEVGYVGNRSRKQLTHNDVNQVLEQNRLAAAFAADANAVNAFRPYSNYGSIYQFERNGRGDYDSLQVLFRTRFTSKSQLQMAYTLSKSKADFGLNDSSGGSSAFAVLDRNNRGLDFAESDINRPHIFVASIIYNMPSFKEYSPAVKDDSWWLGNCFDRSDYKWNISNPELECDRHFELRSGESSEC